MQLARSESNMQADSSDAHMDARCVCFHKRLSHGMGGTGRFQSPTRACFFLDCKCTSFKEVVKNAN